MQITKRQGQWCVKEKEIKDIFEKINLRGLNVVGISDDGNAWKTKETTLKSDNTNAQKLSTEMRDSDTTTVANIKKACGIIVKLKTSSQDFNEKFELAKKWCVV
ncbi:hypothetical protein A6V39_03405 [Candidatus Mycoplasma haematobovis]|uniref:Uncharacterized protein n=1 Tax=Candidatus Mycoplasma haematobovis TaxID=432608 RepID=A0A1A9QBG8_9MOLU|nr:hypothetical protein [Candidatus Mycoplasma haematobovis]OAL09932.1 hypothetical protein A6V39_03405 [Candidatus Mycoplasma haematobovis]